MHASYSKDLANGVFDENTIRHLILNMIRANNVKFREKYGRVVLCCDSKKSWRKEIFPYYKAHRKAARKQQTHIDWPRVFELFSSIKEELIEYTDYPIIEVEGAEGDDVIAVLAMRYNNESQRNIIISADGDFIQLQSYLNVDQYDPINNRWLRSDNPRLYLEEHIIEGDRGDGIPNILSDADTFITPGKRQGVMTKSRLNNFLSSSVDSWEEETFRANWKRNRTLIDLRSVPSSLAKEIVNQFESQINRQGRKIFDYLVKFRLVNLMDCVSEF